MRRIIGIIVVLVIAGCQLGCVHTNPKDWWNARTDGEKIAIGVGTSIVVGALIIRNGEGNPQSQQQEICISTRSLETGCPGR